MTTRDRNGWKQVLQEAVMAAALKNDHHAEERALEAYHDYNQSGELSAAWTEYVDFLMSVSRGTHAETNDDTWALFYARYGINKREALNCEAWIVDNFKGDCLGVFDHPTIRRIFDVDVGGGRLDALPVSYDHASVLRDGYHPVGDVRVKFY